MTVLTKVSLEHADRLLASMIGELAWAARCVDDNILRVEFGDPHLMIHEPRIIPDPQSQLTRNAPMRRVVVAAGRWSLFVEDGLWRVDAAGMQASRFDMDKCRIERCLGSLSGQRLTSVKVFDGERSLSMGFDLAGELTIDFNLDLKGNSQWFVYAEDDVVLNYINKDLILGQKTGP